MLYLLLVIPILLLGLYFYKTFRSAISTFGGDFTSKRAKVLIAVAAFSFAALGFDINGIGTVVLIYVFLFSLIMNFLNLCIKVVLRTKFKKGFTIWKKLRASLLIPCILTSCFIVFGYFNMNNVIKTEYTIYTDKDIREEGYKLGLIADVHYGISLDFDELSEKSNEISKCNLDVLFLCGDIVDDNATKDELKEVFTALSSIKTRYGIFYTYGNHDRQLYKSKRAYTEEEFAYVVEACGIKILRDESVIINDDIFLIGREDFGYREERKNISELISGATEKDYVLVLDHQPKEYKENASHGTDLLLSGHTHGGQLWPANLLMEIIKFNDATYGLYELDEDSRAIVTSGFAGWGFPVKTAASSEYVIVNLCKNR